jgi:hypothetical protein
MGTVGTAKKVFARLHAVPDDPAPAVLAPGRQGMDGALKAVKYVHLAILADQEALVIVVSAYLARAVIAGSKQVFEYFPCFSHRRSRSL